MKRIPEIAGHWLWGSRDQFAAAPHTFPAELGWRHGGLARFRVAHKTILTVTDPDLARHILVTRHDNYVRGVQYRNFSLVVGRGLLVLEGEPWRVRRRQARPAFQPGRLPNVAAIAGEVCAEVLDAWAAAARNGETVDAVSAMQEIALMVISRAVFGAGIDAEAARAYAGYAQEARLLARQRNTSLLGMPDWWPSENRRRREALRQRMDRFVEHRLALARQTASAEENAAMLTVLENARDPETGLGLSREEIVAEAKTLITAGFETTAATLYWALYLLARHPDQAARWHEEVDRVLAGRAPVHEDIARLPHLARIIQESMRLYPLVYSLGRDAVAADELGGHAIPKGQSILISLYGIHRSPALWSAPDEFRPDRFAPDGEAAARQAFFPFGQGKHTCVGNHFALTEMTIVLAMIGQRYRLALPEGYSARVDPRITLDAAGPIPLRLTPRE